MLEVLEDNSIYHKISNLFLYTLLLKVRTETWLDCLSFFTIVSAICDFKSGDAFSDLFNLLGVRL